MQKTALVLSAGGMFGAYQAGAYKAIADMAPPDIIVGASVGALNGWAIAGGCTPDELIARWQHPSAGDALTLFPNHGLQNGWFDPAPLRAQAEVLYRDYQPRLPFGVVLIQLQNLHPRLVQFPDVQAAHLHATCSMPVFLPPVTIAGRRYLDGALFEKIPLWAAIEMGATRIIAVDSMPNVGKWWLHLATDIAHAFRKPRRYPADLDLTIISPSGTLGDANDAVFWKRANIDRWVEMGMRDAAHQITLNKVFSP
jgi:NTE family protein